ncbi:Na(+)-translocating NADH-quinone reductase subunit A [bacterium]|nr:Na(+)-translocating NADH-quinone reductase subunit A [bacterium]
MNLIKNGLDIPILGKPEQKIYSGKPIKTVAVVGADYNGVRPTMRVNVGDPVKLGQILFEDKKTPGVVFTSPGSGTVSAINRGDKRVLLSVVIELKGGEEETFSLFPENELTSIDRERIVENLVKSGLWTAFRTRPFSKVPPPGSVPHSIFVNAMDTNPLAADPGLFLDEQRGAFINGLRVIARLTEGKTYLCKAPETDIHGLDVVDIEVEEFAGVHPAGLSGTHIHFLDPVSAKKTVWHLSYQDAIAIGKLFTTGKIFVERVVSIGGAEVKKPRLIRTRMGASLDDLLAGELSDTESRVISGSVLSGRIARGPLSYLGRYHTQISALREGTHRDFLGWLAPGLNKFSIKNVFLSRLIPGKKFAFTTSREGNKRAMVPIGAYERIMPLDIQPTFLLRSLIVRDTDKAQALGCLELDEEDLGLCSFVCPGKYDYGSILRDNLIRIEREG